MCSFLKKKKAYDIVMLDFVNTKSPFILGVWVWPGFQLKVEGMSLQMEDTRHMKGEVLHMLL